MESHRNQALGSVSDRLGSTKFQCKGATQRAWAKGCPFTDGSLNSLFFVLHFSASAIIGIIFIKEKWKPKDFLSKFRDLNCVLNFI